MLLDQNQSCSGYVKDGRFMEWAGQVLARGCSQIWGCVQTEFSDYFMDKIIVVYDSLEGCLKLN